MNGFADALVPYAEFARVGFVNILAFRLRYFTGIITYFLNVTVYYFIWTAVFHSAQSIAGFSLPQIITYVSVGWMIRSFYWNTIDQEMAYEVIEGKIAMDLIKPVSIQWMWICRAMGESAFRLGLLTLPTAVVVALVFPVQGPCFGREFRAVPCECAGQLLFDGGDQLHDRNVRDSAEIDSGFDSREILADRNAVRPLDSDFIFSGCGAENHGATAVRVHRLRAVADLPWQARPGSSSSRARNAMALGNRDACAGTFLVGTGITEDHNSWWLADEFDVRSAL